MSNANVVDVPEEESLTLNEENGSADAFGIDASAPGDDDDPLSIGDRQHAPSDGTAGSPVPMLKDNQGDPGLNPQDDDEKSDRANYDEQAPKSFPQKVSSPCVAYFLATIVQTVLRPSSWCPATSCRCRTYCIDSTYYLPYEVGSEKLSRICVLVVLESPATDNYSTKYQKWYYRYLPRHNVKCQKLCFLFPSKSIIEVNKLSNTRLLAILSGLHQPTNTLCTVHGS